MVMSHVRTEKEDDSIDFGQLKEELQNAIEADARYWKENEAKIKAVNQNVASYEEFNEIVKASHLKPLSKTDKRKSKPKSWNSLSSNNTAICNTSNKIDLKMDDDSVPSNSHEFEKQWRRICSKNKERQFEFLKRLGGSAISNILKSEIVFGLMSEIIIALKAFDSSSVIDFVIVIEILHSMSQAKRFGLSLQFLNNEEKQDCYILFEKLWKSMSDKLQDLADSGISEITVNNLMSCYNINIHQN